MPNIKSKSKGKIALIILAVIFAVLLCLLLGAYLFVSRVVPRSCNVEKVKTVYADQPNMCVSWEPYENADLRLSGETQTVGSDSFSLTFPAVFTETTSPDVAESGTRTYIWSKNDETVALITISDPMYAPDEEMSEEEKSAFASFKGLMFSYNIFYGYAVKKTFDVTLKDQYSFDLVSNSLNLDKIASDDVYAAYLAAGSVGVYKSINSSTMRMRAIYKVDTPQYNGFIYNFDYNFDQKTDETTEQHPNNTHMMMDVYTLDNRYFPYGISITAKNGVLSEQDIYAIFNSFTIHE